MMTKRIFRSICLVALGVFAASVVLFLLVLYDYFGGVQQRQLQMQAELAAHAVANEGIAYFDGLASDQYRITWVGADGAVIYDNRSDSAAMENHLEREEIKAALLTGEGKSSRYSDTLMERALYAAKRLPDGTVIRLAVSQHTLLTLFLGMLQPICFIIIIAGILSLALASRLAKKIVEPLNALDLEQPLSNEGYDELSPLLHRIDSQQRQIKRQSEELARQQQEFETVTENMTEGIILLSAKGEVIAINSAAKRLFGVDTTAIGQHILAVNRSPQISELLAAAAAGRHAEKMLDIAGGRYQLILSPVSSGNVPSGAVLLVIDATEKEKAEQMRREFTANVSHELKTPLHTIAGSAELLANNMVKEEDKAAFYARIQAETQRMINLVEDIIRLSHLDEGADDIKREPVDVFALAQKTVQALLPEAAKAQVGISLTGREAVIESIPQLLQSIVYNLCDNAIKYNRPGGSVAVSVNKVQNGAVRLTVADTGIGIPTEYQERIFERFYRVDKSRSKELGGTGLGLAIVKHAARLLGAKIELKSAENQGTRITVTFSDTK